jgi:succinate dehydrogenase / fumarate reductase cytochrome b subunit
MIESESFLGSSIGRKIVMAITGLVLFGFVLFHMVGNLQVYLGPEAMNHYAELLRGLVHGWALWAFRIVLLAAVLLHIWAATSLTLDNRTARPVGYRTQRWREATYASRTMRWSGVILFFFIVYHLLHFTTGQAHPDFVPGDVYRNFIVGFQSIPASIAYIVAMVLLGLHLKHGVWSMCQTLGLSHPRYNRAARLASWAFAAIVVIGNISFPLAVLAGVLK